MHKVSTENYSIGEITGRLKSLVDELAGGNVSKFAEIAGVNAQTFHTFLKGRAPNPEALFNICININVNLNWLLTGTGPKYLTETEPPRADDADFSYIPLVEAKLSAGDGSLIVSEKVKQNCAFRTQWLRKTVGTAKGKFLLGVIGDSMAPTIKNGDTVMIDTQATHIYDGNIYALRMDSTIMIKRLALLPGDKVRLISDNKQEYDPIDANRKDIHVLGRVVWFARTLVKTD